MNVIYDPSVEVVGYQVVDAHALDRFLEDHDLSGWHSDDEVGAQVLAEVAGRTCYMSFAKPRPGGNAAYLQRIEESGHGSVLEHGVWNFILYGVSRSFTHELVRHRAGWSYSQLSQRYVDESVCDVVVPPELRQEVEAAKQYLVEHTYSDKREEDWPTMNNVNMAIDHTTDDALLAGLVWLRSMIQTSEDYKFLTDYVYRRNLRREYDKSCDKVAGAMNLPDGPSSFADWQKNIPQDIRTTIRKAARGTGRSVLPNATETKVFCTANCRAVRHFIEQRASRHADVEARKVAVAVWRKLAVLAPHMFGDYTEVLLEDGTSELTTPYKKV